MNRGGFVSANRRVFVLATGSQYLQRQWPADEVSSPPSRPGMSPLPGRSDIAEIDDSVAAAFALATILAADQPDWWLQTILLRIVQG
jgi:hypothetical protein